MALNLQNIPVLMLNASYEALCFVSGKRAFTMLAKGKAEMEATTNLTAHSGRRPHLVPSVIRLRDYRRVPRRTRTLSRKSILARDENTCQYCLAEHSASKLTLDHIIPRSRGGASSWENLIAACFTCNNIKADRTPEEAGMPLRYRPKPFTVHTSRQLLRAAANRPEWRKYLYYENDTPQETLV